MMMIAPNPRARNGGEEKGNGATQSAICCTMCKRGIPVPEEYLIILLPEKKLRFSLLVIIAINGRAKCISRLTSS